MRENQIVNQIELCKLYLYLPNLFKSLICVFLIVCVIIGVNRQVLTDRQLTNPKSVQFLSTEVRNPKNANLSTKDSLNKTKHLVSA